MQTAERLVALLREFETPRPGNDRLSHRPLTDSFADSIANRARQHEKDELETERQRLAMRQAQLDAHQFRGIQDEPRAGLADALLAMRRLLRRE